MVFPFPDRVIRKRAGLGDNIPGTSIFLYTILDGIVRIVRYKYLCTDGPYIPVLCGSVQCDRALRKHPARDS